MTQAASHFQPVDRPPATPLADLISTTKPGITRLVTIVAALAFAVAALGRPWTTPSLVLTALGMLLGTAVSAAGANALNQWMERERDALMNRTADRPLPAGRLHAPGVLRFGLALAVGGCLILWTTCGWIPAAISALTTLSYLACYTPLKPITTLSTIVGAIPGALPVLIGWTAGAKAAPYSGILEPAAWSIFAILFVWQIPHFLAIAIRYRDDYAQGGHRVLPSVEDRGSHTAAVVLVWTACLIPVSLSPAAALPDQLGLLFLIPATIVSLAFAALAVWSMIKQTRGAAIALFVGSIVHLPILLGALVLDAAITG